MFGWLAKKQISGPTSEFLLGNDFETLWGLAFRWCKRETPTVEQAIIPDDVKQMVYRLIRGFFKRDLNLRTPAGKIIPSETLDIFLKDRNPWRNILWRCLSQGQFDMAYLSKLYVERSKVMTWCEKEHLTPPDFWTVPSSNQDAIPCVTDDDDDRGDWSEWYEQLTEQRRRKVAFLEIARHLWKEDRERSYGDTYNHTIFDQAGLRSAFTENSFRKWARPFAPDEAKQGGRRTQSVT